MLSFYFSRFCLSQSQGSRREREFCSLNLRVRDESEIFSFKVSRSSEKQMNQNLARSREIKRSRYALAQVDFVVFHEYGKYQFGTSKGHFRCLDALVK